jgi:hypothetical protein
MRSRFTATLAVVFGLAGVAVAQFAPGNLVVLRVGDGSAALGNSGTASFLDQYSPTGVNQSPMVTYSNPTTGGTRLVASGSTVSEGYITRSADGTQIVVSGYDNAVGTATIASNLSSVTPRVVNGVDAAWNTTRLGSSTGANFSGGNIRSAWSNGTNTWATGSNTGVVVHPGDTAMSTTLTNLRVVGVFNGNLYYTTQSGSNRGIYQVGTGLPTATGTTATNVINTGASGGSVGFAINAAGNVAYIADERPTGTGGGIQKWTFDGTNWALAGTFNSLSGTNGARGLAVDFSGANPVLYATTNDSRLITITDTGANFTDAAIVLATAGTNQAFRGLTFTPVPEPVTVGLIGAAVLGCGAFVRRKLAGVAIA